jgi:two-component system phosphate regulon sensor histidine kinase PhoR
VKRETLRFVLVLAMISIAGIISIQIYWFSRAFDIRDKQFNQTVNIILRSVVDQILTYNGSTVHHAIPVEQLSSNYFVAMVNGDIDANLLETLLVTEFKARNMLVNFEYGIYNCVNEKMVFGNSIRLEDKLTVKEAHVDLPVWENNDYYFGVLFPNKQSTLLNQMGIWIFSSGVLFIVMLFFGYALYIMLRQRKLSQLQKQFINNMTHEFRTPISTIQLSSEVLQDPSASGDVDRLKTYGHIIWEESNKLLHQVENILQVAIIEDKKLRLEKDLIDVHTIIGEVIRGFEVLLSDRQVTLLLEAKHSKIIGDKVHFSNMIKNLLDNAIKYSDDNLELTIKTRNDHKQVVIEVSDNGIGIALSEQKKIFKKFYRVPTGDLHNVKGFGLGLNYVKNMTRIHKGKIYLESKVGFGSTFTLKFPSAHEQ